MSGRSALLLALGLALAACGTKGEPVSPPPADEREVEQPPAVEPAG